MVPKALVPLAIFDQSQEGFKAFRVSMKKGPEYSIPFYRVKGRNVFFQGMWRLETESLPPVNIIHLGKACSHVRWVRNWLRGWKATTTVRILLPRVPFHVLATLCSLWEPSRGFFVPMYQPAETSYRPLESLPTPPLLRTLFDSSCRWEREKKRAKSWEWGGGDQRHRWNERSN